MPPLHQKKYIDRRFAERVDCTTVITPEFDDVYEEAKAYFIDAYVLAEDIELEQAEEDVFLSNQPIDPLATTQQSIYIDIHTVLARLYGHELTLPLAVKARMHHLIAEQLNVLDDRELRNEMYINVCRGIARIAVEAALDASGAFAQYDGSLQQESAKDVLVCAYADKLLERYNLA